jgi:hypothetical protein
VREIVDMLQGLPAADRQPRTDRLIRLGEYQGTIGWGYCDFLAGVAARLRVAPEVTQASRDRRLSEVDGKKRAMRR